MTPITRRAFLGSSTKTFIALGAASSVIPHRTTRAASANETLNFAAIGVGGRCSTLIRGFSGRGDVNFSTLCDVNPKRDRLLRTSKELASRQKTAPKYEQDFRRVLDDPSIDAVIVGTPDHWHAPLAIFACQAGKDVYVEKPPCHNIWEGKVLVEAARRYERVVQVGTQNRSAAYVQRAAELVHGGAIGDVRLCKVFNLKPGPAFKKGTDGAPPEGMDYDTWLGPAPKRAFNERIVNNRGWHMYWDFSGGDMADDGIHQLDIARWLIDREFPRSIHSTGGRFEHRDDREVPDTQVVTYTYDDLVMTFELTHFAPYMRKTTGKIRGSKAFPFWPQNSTRIELYGSKNLMIIGRHGGGWQIFTGDGKVIDEMYGVRPDARHQENFVESIKSRAQPNADPENGHRSTALVHLGNISYRLKGRKLSFDAKTQSFIGDRQADGFLKRSYRRFEPSIT